MGKYFLYRHIRLDKNEPFYIGIGTRVKSSNCDTVIYRRAFTTFGRNEIWHKIVNKTSYEVEIMFESDNREEIENKEIFFIKLYGRIDLKTGILSNLTSGGEGCHDVSFESIEKMKETKRRFPTFKITNKPVYVFSIDGAPETSFFRTTDLSHRFGCDTETIRRAIKEKRQFFGYFLSYRPTIDLRGYDVSRKTVRAVARFEGGEIVSSYRSIKEAARNNNDVSFTSILNSITQNIEVKGVLWRHIPYLEFTAEEPINKR